MARRTVLDTDIFSEVMRGKNEVVGARADAYVKQHGRLTISVITVLEVVKGLQKAGRQDALTRFAGSLASLEIVPMGAGEAILGGRIYGDLERLGQPHRPSGPDDRGHRDPSGARALHRERRSLRAHSG